MIGLCFDEAVARHIVLDGVTAIEREAYMSHAEMCDACLERIADATRSLVSHGPEPATSEVSARPERPGGLFAGRYVLLDTLGQGGMGIVYLAHDSVLGREVALKVLRGSAGRTTEMLRVEARALAAIDHPNVVTVYDLAIDGDRLAVAMERVRGTTLRLRLRRPMRRRVLMRALTGVGEGLAAAHAADVVHGDVKLDNVLVDRDNHARLADFGLSRLVGTAPSVAGGTALFMAPEVARERLSSAASDQYALAACWVDALLGERPTSTEGWQKLAQRVRPLWARKPLARALDAAPEARFGTVQALLTGLRRQRTSFAAAWLGLALTLCIGPWLALEVEQRSSQASCLAAATHDLPMGLPWPAPDIARGSGNGLDRVLTATLWARAAFAYADWRVRWTGLQSAVCAAPEDAVRDLPCLTIERRWVERSLRGLSPSWVQGPLSSAHIATIEFIQFERLCDDPRERAAIARFEASSLATTGSVVDLTVALTLSQGTRASLDELDNVIAALDPERPSRLLVLSLVTRAATRQQARQIEGAQADAEQALDMAARLRRRELQSSAATMLGAIEIQEHGDVAHARQWARLARALSVDGAMLGNLRGITELEANISLVRGRPSEIIAAVDRLRNDPLGYIAAGPRLLTMRGLALIDIGNLADADTALRDAFDARVAELLVDPSRIAGGLNNLATLSHALGDDFQAFEQLEDAERLRTYLPPDHPDRLTLARSRLRFDAEVFGRPDAFAEAVQLERDTRRLFPDNHPDSVEALTVVADLARRSGDLTSALDAASECAARVEQNDLYGVLGALPFVILAELAHDARASLDEALRRVGTILPAAPLCRRIRAVALNLATSPGACAAN